MRTLLTFITMLTCVVAISHAQGVSAHRGDNKNAPENTIPAILSAVKKGAQQIELLNASESDLVAGTVFAPDSYTIPTVSVHWIYKGVKQGARKLERLGIIV